MAPGAGEIVPPGQGQILIVLRGGVLVCEHAGDGKVVQTTRRSSSTPLSRGGLFRVANDARWSLADAEPGTLILALSTSVPREERRSEAVLELARRRPHMSPRLLFENETVRLEFSASRGHLPLRGWVPWSHTGDTVEYAIILAGTFRARLEGGDPFDLPEGSLLRIPGGVKHNLRAGARGLCVGLIVTARVRRSGEPIDHGDVKGRFTPFAR